MINKIKESLEKATPKWHYNGNEIVSLDNPKVGIGGFLTEDDNHLAANAPEWLGFLLDELERLEREYAEERAAHNAHLENVISELEERAKMLKDDYELDGYNELAFSITKLKQVIEDEKS